VEEDQFTFTTAGVKQLGIVDAQALVVGRLRGMPERLPGLTSAAPDRRYATTGGGDPTIMG